MRIPVGCQKRVFSMTRSVRPASFQIPLIYLTVMLGCLNTAECSMDAKHLYDDLMSHYNKLIRPVRDNNGTLNVRLGLKLTQLIDVVS